MTIRSPSVGGFCFFIRSTERCAFPSADGGRFPFGRSLLSLIDQSDNQTLSPLSTIAKKSAPQTFVFSSESAIRKTRARFDAYFGIRIFAKIGQGNKSSFE